MTFSEIAFRMFPYWFFGIFMIYAVYNSKHRDLLRIDFKILVKFCVFLIGITALRCWAIQYLYSGDIVSPTPMPWQVALTVFWEDLAYALPLVILKDLLMGKDLVK